MEETYANVEFSKKFGDSALSINPTGPGSSGRRFHGAVVVCLGLLSLVLLVGFISFSVYHFGSVHGLSAELSSIKANLTQYVQACNNWTEERAQLDVRLSDVSEELNRCLSQQKKTEKTCPTGWTMFSQSCYLLSTKSDTWEKGRENCRANGADLVIIDSRQEQTFLSGFTQDVWFGLTDKQNEGTWKWVDNSPLTLTYWAENQPDNYGEEDCAHLRSDHFWNDLSCEATSQWICKKNA
ncbi:CD209 antigen-like protein C isoform X2 [Anabas testudineus]|uniref:CD209 antigen-like protein C isoform X2 n=1 Tax=Anabas testudineus TaxID=64144 RepID=UPI000E453BEE|nr:CD209 antigen-like protein C isoform X2 [Anabas testudineus]